MRRALRILAVAAILAADIAIGLSLPTSSSNAPRPGNWRDHRVAWATMRFDNRAWLKAMWRAISAPMFIGSDMPPADTPDERDDDSVVKNSQVVDDAAEPSSG